MVPLTTINTRNILFICGGAFPDLEEIIKQRLTKQSSIGFNAELKDAYDKETNIVRYDPGNDVIMCDYTFLTYAKSVLPL